MIFHQTSRNSFSPYLVVFPSLPPPHSKNASIATKLPFVLRHLLQAQNGNFFPQQLQYLWTPPSESQLLASRGENPLPWANYVRRPRKYSVIFPFPIARISWFCSIYLLFCISYTNQLCFPSSSFGRSSNADVIYACPLNSPIDLRGLIAWTLLYIPGKPRERSNKLWTPQSSTTENHTEL